MGEVRILTTIGRVSFVVDFDGNTLPAQSKALGEEVGTVMGDEASKRFQARFGKIAQELTPQLQKNGTLAGFTISEAMTAEIQKSLRGASNEIAQAFLPPKGLDQFSHNFTTVDAAANKLRDDLQLLHDTGNLDDSMWNRFGGTLNQWLGQARKVEAESVRIKNSQNDLKVAVYDAEQAFGDIEKAFSKFGGSGSGGGGRGGGVQKALEDQGSLWNKLSFNMRQAVVVVAAIASAGNEIAVLGSAVGAGIDIVGTAAVAAGAGLGVLVLGIVGVVKELTDPVFAKNPAVIAIQNLQKAFKGLAETVGSALIDGMGPAITTFTNVFVPAFTAGVTSLATLIGGSLQSVLDGFSTPTGLKEFQGFIAGAASLLPGIILAADDLGKALGNLFILSVPAAQKFIGFLDKISQEFLDFTNSTQGRKEISEWLSNGVTVLGSFGKLVAAAAKVLADLVTPATVKLTTSFLDQLTKAMPFIEKLVSSFSTFDVFGLVADVLNTIGNALGPVLDLLSALGTILNPLIQLALQPLAAVFQVIGILLTPLTFAFQLLGDIITRISTYLQPLWVAFNSIFTAVQAGITAALVPLKDAFDQIFDALFGLLPSPQALASIITTQVVPAIQQFSAFVVASLIPAIQQITGMIVGFIDKAGGFEGLVTDFQIWTIKITGFFKVMYDALHGNFLGIQKDIADTIGSINKLLLKQAQNTTKGFQSGPNGLYALGGIINTATVLNMQGAVGGEAGPEAIVPLSKPLSQVDPSVRWLSAIAQGKFGLGMGGSGLSVAPGAIVVMEAGNGQTTASAIMDRLVVMAGT